LPYFEYYYFVGVKIEGYFENSKGKSLFFSVLLFIGSLWGRGLFSREGVPLISALCDIGGTEGGKSLRLQPGERGLPQRPSSAPLPASGLFRVPLPLPLIQKEEPLPLS